MKIVTKAPATTVSTLVKSVTPVDTAHHIGVRKTTIKNGGVRPVKK